MNANRSTPVSKRNGFTLIEMLTSLTILSIMAVIAVPGLGGMVRSSKVRGAQSELVASLMLARSEAVRRGVTVSVAAAASVPGKEYSNGWTVFVDSNGDGVVSASDIVIRRFPDISAGVTLGSTSNTTLVSFAPTGFLAPATATAFKVCGKNDATSGYLVSLQPVGLADVSDQAVCP